MYEYLYSIVIVCVYLIINVHPRFCSNVLGPISFTEAQCMYANILRKHKEMPPSEERTEDALKEAWMEHVTTFNGIFCDVSASETYKHS